MSMTKSGRLRRGRMTSSIRARVNTGSVAPVAVITMSAADSASGSDAHGTARPLRCRASVSAAASVRLAIASCFTCCACRWTPVSFAISPAPRINTPRPFRSPKIFFASDTAA